MLKNVWFQRQTLCAGIKREIYPVEVLSIYALQDTSEKHRA
jgi:hypothetical protein